MTLTHGELFAGISGFGLGFERAGIPTKWAVEIDPTCRTVLRRHHPDTLVMEDVREVGAHNLCPVDVITFGSPCQDLSVAGKRAGFDGARSGLFFEAVRIIRELRPRFIVWENVPGALSSAGGRDFGAALDALADAGALDIAWSVLDAQWWGLAQRRKRVFVVADFGGECAAAVLFEPESGGGHPPPRRETGQGTARGAAVGVGYGGNNTSGPIPVACGLNAKGGSGRMDFETETLIVPTLAHSLRDQGQLAHREDVDTLIPAIAHTLRAGGVDAGEDGTGRGTPLSPIAFSSKDSGHDATTDLAPTMRSMNFDRSHINGGGQLAVAVPIQDAREVEKHQNGVGIGQDGDPMFTLDTASQHGVQQGMAVRRLTPTECARLQGFPDDWLDGHSDSAKYRMLGNAVAVPVAQWIGERIARLA